MKRLSAFVLICALSAAALAEDSNQKKMSPGSADPKPDPVILASKAKVTAPMTLKDGVISQPERTELVDGGKAVFEFTVPKDGSYVIHAVVKAPDDDTNSFYVNIDAQPEDPLMIWDIELTSEFADQVVSWRGSGEAGSDEFTPKVFKLTAGAHKLILTGREPAQLKSVSIQPAGK